MMNYDKIDFVNCPYKHGELTPYEREFLYRWIRKIKPKCIFEVGTGYGGSTYYMAEAIARNENNGELYTCDIRKKPVDAFFHNYPFVKFFAMSSDALVVYVREKGIEIDFMFFDGPNDPQVALDNFIELDAMCKSGTYFSMHDWDYVKSSKLRPFISSLSTWKEIEVVTNKDYSVGICLYKKL